MNYIDIILIIPIIWYAYQGFKRGFVIELASLLALVLGIYAALYFSGFAADFLVNNFDMESRYIPVVSFIITFIIVVFLVYMVGKILEKVINMVALGFINKLAGGLFGVLKAALFLSIVIMIINHFNANWLSVEKKESSILYKPIEDIAPRIWQNIEGLDDHRFQDIKEDIEEISA